MRKEELRNLKVKRIVVIMGDPLNPNYGKLGIVRFIEIHDSGSGYVYLEPFNCEFEVNVGTPVLCGEVTIYGFRSAVISYPEGECKTD